jgi:hypothetical protein
MYFITAADSKFYFFLPYMVAQIERLFPKARLIVYDLGLEDDEVSRLREWGAEVKKWHIGPGEAVKAPNYYPRALHKPSMILDALEMYPNESAVYLDADALPNRKFAIPRGCDVAVTLVNQDDLAWPRGCDVAVTLVNQDDLAWLEKNPHIEYNGIFNTGVMLFGRSKRRLAFVSEWADRLDKSEELESDQRIAWLLLEEMEGFSRQEYGVTNTLKVRGEDVAVRVLHPDKWNLFALRCNILMGEKRMPPEDVNVLHFKGNSMHNTADFRNCMKQGQMDLQTKGVPLC